MSYAEKLFANTLNRLIEAREYKFQREVSPGIRVYTASDGKGVVIHFSVYQNLHKKSLEEISNSITQLGCKSALVTCKSKTSSSNNDAFKRIEILDFHTSLHDPTNIGGGTVTIRKQRSDETKPDTHCVPTMLTTDKVARFLDCKPGDIVVITRKFPEISTVPFIEYRVVQTTSEKTTQDMLDEEDEDDENEEDEEGDDDEEGDEINVVDDEFIDEEPDEDYVDDDDDD
jgi:hypothetical protein